MQGVPTTRRFVALWAGLAFSLCATSSTFADPLRFVVVGDTQGSSAGTADFVSQLVDDIDARNPAFVMFPGDLVGTGSVSTFDSWGNTTSQLGNTRYMVPGNHDLSGRPATNADWQSSFSWLPNSQVVSNITTADPSDTIQGVNQIDYYVDVSPEVRIISVTTDRDLLPGESSNYPPYDILGGPPRSLDWFQSVMAMQSTKDKEHVFVFTHHPVTSQSNPGTFGAEEESTSSEWWKSIAGTSSSFDGAAATALFTGHIHAYLPNRPDPHSDTAEPIVGTGGGPSEGVPHRQVHGFMEVVVDGGNVSTTFYGDSNESVGGWSFTEELDTFTILDGGNAPQGEQAHYQFEAGATDQDSSTSPLSKNHQLHFNSGASVVNDPVRGSVLSLDGNAFVDAKSIGDQNFQILGDLKIQLWAKAEGALGGSAEDNILVAFGDADGSRTTGGGHDAETLEDEIANYAYQLSYTADGRLRLSWEYRDNPTDNSPSSVANLVSTDAVADPDQWHQIEVLRDGESNMVRFLLDGAPLGSELAFGDLPTGGGAGSLYFGALPDTSFGNTGGLATFAGRLDDILISSESVTIAPALVGDINGDGVVAGDGMGPMGTDDVTAFIAGWMKPSSAEIRSDINFDGITDIFDAVLFNRALIDAGASPFPAELLAAVPEPGSMALMLLGVLGLLTRVPSDRKRRV